MKLPLKYMRALRKATLKTFKKDIDILKAKLSKPCYYCNKDSMNLDESGCCSNTCNILRDCKKKTLRIHTVIEKLRKDILQINWYSGCCFSKERVCNECMDDIEKNGDEICALFKEQKQQIEDIHALKREVDHYKIQGRWHLASLIIAIIGLLFLSSKIQAADLIKITRSPAIECMRTLDITLHASLALGIEPEEVERLMMKRADNYDKIATVAFPLKGMDIEEIKQYLLEQCQ